jgi:hypothetical protein
MPVGENVQDLLAVPGQLGLAHTVDEGQPGQHPRSEAAVCRRVESWKMMYAGTLCSFAGCTNPDSAVQLCLPNPSSAHGMPALRDSQHRHSYAELGCRERQPATRRYVTMLPCHEKIGQHVMHGSERNGPNLRPEPRARTGPGTRAHRVLSIVHRPPKASSPQVFRIAAVAQVTGCVPGSGKTARLGACQQHDARQDSDKPDEGGDQPTPAMGQSLGEDGEAEDHAGARRTSGKPSNARKQARFPGSTYDRRERSASLDLEQSPGAVGLTHEPPAGRAGNRSATCVP